MRVIITDDHRLFREGLKLILAGVEGVEVVGEVGDGLALFELLETVPVEVVLLDLGMAQMSGFGVLERLRDPSERPKTPVSATLQPFQWVEDEDGVLQLDNR